MKHRASAIFVAFFIAPIMLQTLPTAIYTGVVSADTTTSSASSEVEQQGIVTVKYVDEADGHTIASTQFLVGTVGQNFNLVPASIRSSMEYVGVDGNPNGQYTTGPQTVVFKYKRIPNVFTISSFDENGNSLGDDQILKFNGQNFDLFHADTLDKAGWKIDLDKSIYTEGENHATLRQMMEMSNTTTAEEFANFFNEQLKTLIIDETHFYTKTDTSIDVVYSRIQSSVTANYVDENGNVFSDPKTMTGNIGDTYSFETQDISGYTLTNVTGSISGTYGNDDQTVTYVYKKTTQNVDVPETDKLVENTSDNSEENDTLAINETSKDSKTDVVNNNDKVIATSTLGVGSDTSQSAKTTFDNLNVSSVNNQKSLPETGMQMTTSLTSLGLTLISIGLAPLYQLVRKYL